MASPIAWHPTAFGCRWLPLSKAGERRIGVLRVADEGIEADEAVRAASGPDAAVDQLPDALLVGRLVEVQRRLRVVPSNGGKLPRTPAGERPGRAPRVDPGQRSSAQRTLPPSARPGPCRPIHVADSWTMMT